MTTKPNGNARLTRLGRPPKADKEQWIQVTCVLRKDTVESLRAGADSKHFGEFLQAHLNRYPPPSREQYLSLNQNVPYYTMVKRNKRVPTLMAAGSLSREARKLARERARRERMSPEERAWDDAIRDIGLKVYDGA
jgi:hypothetical protein